MPDIDLDFANRIIPLKKIKHIDAVLESNKKHNTGIYVQSIPYNPIENSSTLDYKSAEDRGYFKIDFLNVSVYEGVRDKAHLTRLLETEPLWELLLEDEFTDKLFHVNGHGSILKEMKPQSIEQLAAILAVIRPAKRYLIGQDWAKVMNEVWIKPENDEYFFKKAHAIAYAHVIVVQMNLIIEGLTNGSS